MSKDQQLWTHPEMRTLHGLVAQGRRSEDIAEFMGRSLFSVKHARRRALPGWRKLHIEGNPA